MKNVIFGIGSGRCGTTSLASLLNAQSDSIITHEMSGRILLPWEFDENKMRHYLETVLNRRSGTVGDVSFYLINYISKIFEEIPNSKAIILKRGKEETINSMMRKTVGLNHWVTNPKKHSPFDQCFPKFDFCPNKDERISLYYDRYYDLCNQLDQSKCFWIKTEDLNKEPRVIEMLTWCGFENPKFIKFHKNKT